MKKTFAYWAGAALVTGSLWMAPACTKSTTTDDDLIGNWKRSDDFEGNARSEAIAFTVNNRAYVGTGSTNTERFNDLWEYDTDRRYWIQKASLPGNGRSSAVAFSIGNKGYVGTGYDGITRLRDFWEFDPDANTWTQKADFAGTARYDAVAFAVNDKGFIGCGYDGNYLKDLWEYTPGTNASDPGSWAQKASVGGAKRSAAISFVHNNVAYVLGGNNNGEIQQDLWAYDAAQDAWTRKKEIYNYSDESFDDDWGTIARQNAVVFTIGNYIYLATGETSSITSITWRYDPVNDNWLEKTPFEQTGRTGAVGFSLANRGFVVTGRSGSLMMDNMYEFFPDAEQVDND